MRLSVTEAKGQLTELVRRAEAGDEVILTRHGHPVAQLTAVRAVPDGKSRRALLETSSSKCRNDCQYRVTAMNRYVRGLDKSYGSRYKALGHNIQRAELGFSVSWEPP